MILSQSEISCGVRQAHDLWKCAVDNMGDLGWYLYENTDQGWDDAAFIVWSDVAWSAGYTLYLFIKETFPYSTIHRTFSVHNPNSGNNIEVYMWTLPSEEFKSWWENNYVDP